jgi:hypothetical protein
MLGELHRSAASRPEGLEDAIAEQEATVEN